MRADELTDLASDWLVATFPGSIVIRELSVADWGGASLDVAAVTEAHIVGVEVKGEGDSPSRLDRQGLSYGMVVREMWLLCAPSLERSCFPRRPKGWGRLEVRDGRVRPFNLATKAGPPEQVAEGRIRYPSIRDDTRYMPDRAREQRHQTPWTLCGALWREELLAIARRYGLSCGGRAALVEPLTEAICGSLPVTLIHDEMVRALRTRRWRNKRVLDTRPSLEVDASASASGGLLV
jgi:hypothetical protein